MERETYTKGTLIERRVAEGVDWRVYDGAGVEQPRERLTPEELARFQAEGQPSPDEKLVTALGSAITVTDVVTALIERHGK